MTLAALGRVGVLTALVAAVAAVAVGWWAWRRDEPQTASWASLAARIMFLGAALAMAALVAALVADDFSLRYVAENHARSTPLVYSITTAWSALEGSIVLWGLVLAGFTLAVARTLQRHDRLGVVAVGVLGIVSVFFFGLMATAADPFAVVDPVPLDGPGPNPLLRNHLLVAVHPPLLYVGYVGFSVPFAFGIAALLLGQAGPGWLERTRRATLVAWTFLTAGIAVGALWSYEVLGWGGYWAWDPVENASLIPWLAATAFVHSAIAQARRGVLKAWNVTLVIATFALTILGTFLTRSGVVASVHSFTQSAVGPALLGFLVVVLVASLGLFAARAHLVAGAPRLDRLVSREGAFLLNNLLLTVLTFVVVLGTTYPIVLEAITGAQVSVGRPFFDRFAVPIAVVLLVAAAVGPLLPYRAARPGLLRERLLVPVVVALGAGAALVLAGVRVASVVGIGVLASLVVAAAAGELVRQAGGDGSSGRHRAVARVLRRNPGYWGGQLAHVGFAVMAFAIAVTGALGTEATVTLEVGDAATVDGYELRYDGLVERDEPGRTARIAEVAVSRDGTLLETLGPRLNVYAERGQAVGTPSVRTGWDEDLYLALRRLEADVIDLEVYRYPGMWLLWVGAALVALGGAGALAGRRRARRRHAPSAPHAAEREEVGVGP